MSAMLAAALDFAGRGWPIFPLHAPIGGGRCSCPNAKCSSVGKHPRTKNGFEDASTDLAQIHAWWSKWPAANIAVHTGVVCDVFDIDHDDQLEGTADFRWAVDMPGGPVVRTGAGWHYYLAPTGLGNRTRFTEHCDWRGAGGYAILPPSLHHSGRRYEWFTPISVALNPAPAALLALLTDPAPTVPPVDSHRSVQLDPARFARGRWSPTGLIGRVAMAADGTRNDTLVWAANRIGLDYHEHKATGEEVDRALDQLHEAAVRAGLTDREVQATIRSGFDKGVDGKTNACPK